jgi:hypothetical protein
MLVRWPDFEREDGKTHPSFQDPHQLSSIPFMRSLIATYRRALLVLPSGIQMRFCFLASVFDPHGKYLIRPHAAILKHHHDQPSQTLYILLTL